MSVAAVLYILLNADWCVAGYGLHQAAVSLGWFGPDAPPQAGLTIWGALVRMIGWDIRGLGALSAAGALFSVGFLMLMAERVLTAAVHRAERLELQKDEFRFVVPVAVVLTGLSFVLTPGFLRAATTVDPLPVLAAILLSGLYLLTLVFVMPTEISVRQVRACGKLLAFALLVSGYGVWSVLQIGWRAILSNVPSVLCFAFIGLVPLLALANLARTRRLLARRFKVVYLSAWALAVAVAGVVAVMSADRGQVASRLVGRIIARAADARAIVSNGALDEMFLFMRPPDRRVVTLVRDREPAYGRELADWVRSLPEAAPFREDLVFAAELGPKILIDEWMRLDPKACRSALMTSAHYFPTVESWREAYAELAEVGSGEPLGDYLRLLLGACGNHLGCRFLEAGDGRSAWVTFWEVLDKVDRHNYTAVVNLYGMIQRGAAVSQNTRDRLDALLLEIRNRLKTAERLALAAQAGGRLYIDPVTRRKREEARRQALERDAISPQLKELLKTIAAAMKDLESAEKARQAIRRGLSKGQLRTELIGDQLLALDRVLGDWISAEKDAITVLRVDRTRSSANAVMGTVSGMRGEYERAERYLRRAMRAWKDKPGNPDPPLLNDLAFTLTQLGRAKEAIPLAEWAVRERPENWNFRETLAISLIRGGRADEGERELDAAIELAKKSGLQDQRGFVRFNLDRAWLSRVRGDTDRLKYEQRIMEYGRKLSEIEQAELKEIGK